MRAYWQLIAVALVAAAIAAGAVWYLKPDAPAVAPAPRAPEPAAPMPAHAPLPRMQLVAQYGGPLQDTLIQRLRDPIDGTTCYLYLPIAVHHSPPLPETGYVEYGANTVGSISCFPVPIPRLRLNQFIRAHGASHQIREIYFHHGRP